MQRWRPTLLAVLLFACSCSSARAPTAPAIPSPLPRGTLHLAGGKATLSVQIAETEAARERGLMYVSSLPPDSGMVFLFAGSTDGGFWMKNTLIPLSIAFWDEQGRIVDILEMAPCKTASCPLYTPQAGYVGAVEANQGWFSSHGIAVGDTVELTR